MLVCCTNAGAKDVAPRIAMNTTTTSANEQHSYYSTQHKKSMTESTTSPGS